jgi:hypothetical protein
MTQNNGYPHPLAMRIVLFEKGDAKEVNDDEL